MRKTHLPTNAIWKGELLLIAIVALLLLGASLLADQNAAPAASERPPDAESSRLLVGSGG
jgi:hypothetical protein